MFDLHYPGLEIFVNPIIRFTEIRNTTLPETNSSPLKVGGWEMILSFWDGLFSGSMLVSGETHGNALHEYTYFIHLAYSIYCRSDRFYVIEYMQHIHDVLVHDTQPCAVSVLECRSYMGKHRENSGEFGNELVIR